MGGFKLGMGDFRIGAALAVALLIAAPALAVNYKNPAHDYEDGQFSVGANIESFSRTVEDENGNEFDFDITVVGAGLGFGLGGEGLLNLNFNLVSIEPDGGDTATGAEISAQYRHNLDADAEFEADAKPFQRFRLGLVFSARLGSAEDSAGNGVDYYQFDGGFGGSTPLFDQALLYAGGVVSILGGEAFSGATDDTVEIFGTDPVGLFGGFEIKQSETLILGAELHVIHEWGIGLYIDALL